MYTIAIAIQKGGTAKTTTALCLGGALVLSGYKVLVVDLDPQANATSSLIDLDEIAEGSTIYELLNESDVTIEQTIMQTGCGIDLVPANIALALAEQRLITATNRERKLQRKLSRLIELNPQDAGLNYDFVLLDCPPSLGLLTINALSAADAVIVPMQCEYYSERGFNDFLATMNEVKQEINSKLDLLGVLLTMYTQTKTSKDVATNMRQVLGDKVFKTQIARRTILSEVGVKGPVQSYAPTSESAQEYNAFAQEVIKNVKKR
jgi:chromosome partitioning protein